MNTKPQILISKQLWTTTIFIIQYDRIECKSHGASTLDIEVNISAKKKSANVMACNDQKVDVLCQQEYQGS